MKIVISDNKKIASIQEDFSKLFPYLRLEFYTHSNLSGNSSAKSVFVSPKKSIGECRTIRFDGEIEILPQTTVSELLDSFLYPYGLNIKLLRQSGKIWLETSVTDNWTLEEQNAQGQDLSS